MFRFRPQLTAGSWPPDLLRDNTTGHESLIRDAVKNLWEDFVTSLREM